MFVAATSRCFPELPLEAALHRLVDLEYSYVELMLHETDGHIKPSEILADLDRAVMLCRQTHRMTVAAFSVELDTPDEGLYYRQFAAICKLAKATKVVTLTVRSSELGTPFNAEIERLRAMVAIATNESVRVGLLTESRPHDAGSRHGRRLLRQREGLGITLDPSHYIFGPQAGANYEPLMKHVYHIRLRDTNKSSLASPRGPGRSRIRPVGQPTRQSPLRPRAVRRYHSATRRRSNGRNAEDAAAAGEFAVAIHFFIRSLPTSNALPKNSPTP